MSFTLINPEDTLTVTRVKLNDNFTDIYGGGANLVAFETVSKNVKSWNATYSYTSDRLTSISYTDEISTIVKTLNYTGELLTSVVLSGDTPSGIELTKTLTYTGTMLSGASYA